MFSQVQQIATTPGSLSFVSGIIRRRENATYTVKNKYVAVLENISVNGLKDTNLLVCTVI